MRYETCGARSKEKGPQARLENLLKKRGCGTAAPDCRPDERAYKIASSGNASLCLCSLGLSAGASLRHAGRAINVSDNEQAAAQGAASFIGSQGSP